MEYRNGGMLGKRAGNIFCHSIIPIFHIPWIFYVILKNYLEIHKRIKSPLVIEDRGLCSKYNKWVPVIKQKLFFVPPSFFLKPL